MNEEIKVKNGKIRENILLEGNDTSNKNRKNRLWQLMIRMRKNRKY